MKLKIFVALIFFLYTERSNPLSIPVISDEKIYGSADNDNHVQEVPFLFLSEEARIAFCTYNAKATMDSRCDPYRDRLTAEPSIKSATAIGTKQVSSIDWDQASEELRETYCIDQAYTDPRCDNYNSVASPESTTALVINGDRFVWEWASEEERRSFCGNAEIPIWREPRCETYRKIAPTETTAEFSWANASHESRRIFCSSAYNQEMEYRCHVCGFKFNIDSEAILGSGEPIIFYDKNTFNWELATENQRQESCKNKTIAYCEPRCKEYRTTGSAKPTTRSTTDSRPTQTDAPQSATRSAIIAESKVTTEQVDAFDWATASHERRIFFCSFASNMKIEPRCERCGFRPPTNLVTFGSGNPTPSLEKDSLIWELAAEADRKHLCGFDNIAYCEPRCEIYRKTSTSPPVARTTDSHPTKTDPTQPTTKSVTQQDGHPTQTASTATHCQQNSDCAPEEFCHSRLQRCEECHQERQRCRHSAMCCNGTQCRNGLCLARLALGSTCMADQACGQDACCTRMWGWTTVCKPRLREGQRCHGNQQGGSIRSLFNSKCPCQAGLVCASQMEYAEIRLFQTPLYLPFRFLVFRCRKSQ